MATISTAARLAIMDQLRGAGGVLNTPTLILFQNNLTITPATLVGELVECTYSGYVAEAGVTFQAAIIDPELGVVLVSESNYQFHLTAITVPNTVYGWALTNVGKTALYVASLFPTPYVLDAVNEEIGRAHV